MHADRHTHSMYVTYVLYTDKKPGHMDRFEQEILESEMCRDKRGREGEGRGMGRVTDHKAG